MGEATLSAPGRPSSREINSTPPQIAHQCGCGISNHVQVLVSGLQGACQDDWIFNMVMDHLIAKLAQRQPRLRRHQQPESLRAIQIVYHGTRRFAYRLPPNGQQFVSHGILQASEAAHERPTLSASSASSAKRLAASMPNLAANQALIGLAQVGGFQIDHPRQKLQSREKLR
jgi:hypothetical protein